MKTLLQAVFAVPLILTMLLLPGWPLLMNARPSS